ncbi:MAG: chlorite dismutase [Anaerolineae bacterium]|nr:MAG: chlorite dismutase [Anaerolineae bacterium]
MPEQTPRSLNHFGFYRFTESFFGLNGKDRANIVSGLLKACRTTCEQIEIYQTSPARHDADILIWSALLADDPAMTREFFTRAGAALSGFRQWLQPAATLWGFTKPSQYTKSRSAQELDPFSKERKPYLVIYPFTKIQDWYLMSRDARQGMMNEHIRIGKEFPQITQLLLYSFGVQDQEFVVVYETDDLSLFSDLVYALRDTEARRYTKSDAPLYTAFHQSPEETLALWCTQAQGEE